MIARLRGTVVERSTDGVVLDVGGVGYLVAATPTVVHAADRGAQLVIETHLHVREDAMQLYGFADASERELFTQLLTVNGIGPKVALAVVSGSPAAELRRAIALGDTARFTAIPGIGKKTAERIVLELRGSIADAVEGNGSQPESLVARDALVELGFTIDDAERALAFVDPELPLEEQVRHALRGSA